MRTGLLRPTILTFALAVLYGCGDDVTDPDTFLESAEAEAVLRSARALPTLPDLMERAAPTSSREQAVVYRATELWAAGSLVDVRADSRRRLAIGYALPVLVERLSPEDWSSARERIDDWIATVEATLQHLPMPRVMERIDVARRYLLRSDASRDDERRRAYYLLLAISELVETTPRHVAQSLLRDASLALASHLDGGGEGRDRAIARAARLKDWAEQAVDEGDYLLAIQRAYYAIQLVEGP